MARARPGRTRDTRPTRPRPSVRRRCAEECFRDEFSHVSRGGVCRREGETKRTVAFRTTHASCFRCRRLEADGRFTEGKHRNAGVVGGTNHTRGGNHAARVRVSNRGTEKEKGKAANKKLDTKRPHRNRETEATGNRGVGQD